MQTARDKFHWIWIGASTLLFFVASTLQVSGQSSPNFVLKKSSMSGGGGKGSSPTLSVSSGVGQAAPLGQAASPSFSIQPGFFEPNRAPTAAAGSDIVVECSSPTRTPVTLDGSGSTDPDKDTIHYAWTGIFGSATGPTPTVGAPLGPMNITLVVNDDQAHSAPDQVQVSVIVRPEGFDSPLAPLVAESESAPLPARAFRQGRVLPLKLRLLCGGVPVTDRDGVQAPLITKLLRMGEPINLETTDLNAGEANDNGLAFRFSIDDSWVYNLSTKFLSAGTYALTIQMPDGRRHSASFILR